MATNARYIVYRTVASGAEEVGYVVNALVWDGIGSQPIIPAGTHLAKDPDQVHQIGSIYSAAST